MRWLCACFYGMPVLLAEKGEQSVWWSNSWHLYKKVEFLPCFAYALVQCCVQHHPSASGTSMGNAVTAAHALIVSIVRLEGTFKAHRVQLPDHFKSNDVCIFYSCVCPFLSFFLPPPSPLHCITVPKTEIKMQASCQRKALFNQMESCSPSLVLWIPYFCLVSLMIRSFS